jgi:prepilin-type N-terminal cleavage/methylation domain-containing protein
MQYMKKQKGFTLVEMVISIAVGLVIIAVIYAAVNWVQRSTVNVERKVAAHQDARAALVVMSLEIQMASFNPTYPPGAFWMAPGDCTTQSGNQNYRGIQAATDSSITVEADINENGSVAKSGDPNINPNEIITYTYDAANQYITRETGCGGNYSFLGGMSGNPSAVRVINTAEVPVFKYFDAQGTPIAPSGLPVGIPNIARIDITLWVETKDVDPNSGQRRRMVYSTSVIPRNHVIKQ